MNISYNKQKEKNKFDRPIGYIKRRKKVSQVEKVSL